MALPDLRIVTDRVCVTLDSFFVHKEGAHAQMRVAHRDPTTGSGHDGIETSWIWPLGEAIQSLP